MLDVQDVQDVQGVHGTANTLILHLHLVQVSPVVDLVLYYDSNCFEGCFVLVRAVSEQFRQHFEGLQATPITVSVRQRTLLMNAWSSVF